MIWQNTEHNRIKNSEISKLIETKSLRALLTYLLAQESPEYAEWFTLENYSAYSGDSESQFQSDIFYT